LARLANSPFIKIEASKFTEVGYVGAMSIDGRELVTSRRYGKAVAFDDVSACRAECESILMNGEFASRAIAVRSRSCRRRLSDHKNVLRQDVSAIRAAAFETDAIAVRDGTAFFARLGDERTCQTGKDLPRRYSSRFAFAAAVCRRGSALDLFDDDVGICVDADSADIRRDSSAIRGREFWYALACTCGCERVRAAEPTEGGRRRTRYVAFAGDRTRLASRR